MAELKQHVSVDEDNSKVDYIKSQSLALSNRFKRSLGNNATVHDELLKNLTLDNMKIEKPDEKHDAKKTKKHTKMVKHWVDIMEALRTENEKIDFAALTVFRNSGIPTLDNKHIEQIINCIIKPYLNMENEKIPLKEQLELLLNHLLLLAICIKHYASFITKGLINFYNRVDATNIVKKNHIIVIRSSFSQVGVIAHTSYRFGIESEQHTLINEIQDIIIDKKITYNVKTLHNNMAIQSSPVELIKHDCFENFLAKCKNIHNIMGNVTKSQLDAIDSQYLSIKSGNNSHYGNINQIVEVTKYNGVEDMVNK